MESRMVRLSWTGSETHSSVVARAVAGLCLAPDTGDLSLLVQGRSVPCHRSVLAAASPYLASLITEDNDTLSLAELNISQVNINFNIILILILILLCRQY